MSLNDRLAQYFREREGQWIDGRQLATVAGSYAWRSRCSDLRLQYGMDIQNRQRKVRGAIGMMVVSEYRLVSDAPVGCVCATMADPPCGWCDGPDRDSVLTL